MALSLDLRCLLPDQYDQQRYDHPDLSVVFGFVTVLWACS